jgi:ribonucleoside-diphosphate reductase beta chain
MPLDFDTFPLETLRRGRELAWDPHAIDMTQDRADWLTLSPTEQQVILGQVFGFLIGERAVAHDLAPLQGALRIERGHMDEEMYITQQLYEESTHVEFFQRWLFEVLPGELGEDIPYPPGDPSRLIREHLPEALNALLTDQSPSAQMYAVVVYHQIIEGVSAEVGYEVFYNALEHQNIMPGLHEGVRNIQIDESRHVAFGTYLAQRIIRDFPETEEVFIKSMDDFLEIALESARQTFKYFEPPYPFGMATEPLVALTETLHQRRKESVLQGHLVTN